MTEVKHRGKKEMAWKNPAKLECFSNNQANVYSQKILRNFPGGNTRKNSAQVLVACTETVS